MKIALTGPVALELIASYAREAGFDVMPQDASLVQYRPDFVFDVTAHDAVLATEVPGFYDSRLERLAGAPYSLDGIRAIVEEMAWASRARAAKVLAVDADNTLWKGILTEDGVEALCPQAVFQAGLKALSHRGVALVLLSKNNADEMEACLDALAAKNPALLTKDDFACRKVNWAPKAGNLLEATASLNIDPSSVVFLDDNPFERVQMAAHLPSVVVAPWTGWSDGAWRERQILRRLDEYFFSSVGATAEDRLRTHDLQANAQRADAALSFASHDDYLLSLGLWVEPSLATARDLDRLAQMAAKTNQFNATTRRRTREEFAALLSSPDFRVFVFRAGDRFGAQGLVLYLVVDLKAGVIVDFVMSCRAMGRTLEHFALAYVERILGRSLQIDFIPSPKNKPFAAFLKMRTARTFFTEREVRP